jgi:hypothetical protein
MGHPVRKRTNKASGTLAFPTYCVVSNEVKSYLPTLSPNMPTSLVEALSTHSGLRHNLRLAPLPPA